MKIKSRLLRLTVVEFRFCKNMSFTNSIIYKSYKYLTNQGEDAVNKGEDALSPWSANAHLDAAYTCF